jgi:hypothetical protein
MPFKRPIENTLMIFLIPALLIIQRSLGSSFHLLIFHVDFRTQILCKDLPCPFLHSRYSLSYTDRHTYLVSSTPDIIWEVLTVNNNPNYSMQLNNTILDFVNANFLTQLTNTPTRNDNILDLVLSTNPDIIYDLEIHPGNIVLFTC